MKNPTKLMGLVKTVGDKLDGKMKSGELKESELISEATEIMNKMKNMPGMDNIQSMLSKMGMGDMAGMAGMAGMGGKLNMGAMESQLNSRMKMDKTKERIRAKAEANAKTKMEQQNQQSQPALPTYSEDELLKLFGSAEKVERTPRGSKPPNDGNKKKKGKK
jgi:spore coat protein CotH